LTSQRYLKNQQLSEILEELIINNFIEECFDDSIKEDYKEKLYELIINFKKELGLKCK
tara:strand:+ start:2199 stop:2372 length:174 start_codon:yes stop_codon:yes gene_type:complete